MKRTLNPVIREIENAYKDLLQADGRNYIEVSISAKARDLGLSELPDGCENLNAIVPIKHPVEGMKVRIDGRTFINYVQFSSGVIVPNYVIRHTDIVHKPYKAQHSLICNFN